MDSIDKAPKSLQLTQAMIEQMSVQVRLLAPEEACGLLAGIEDRVYEVIPVENELHSRVRYRMDPLKQLRAFQYIDDKEWDLLGIYHSHPNGPNHPSPTDIREAYYPQVIYLIWSYSSAKWRYRAFQIHQNGFHEFPIMVIATE